MKWALEINTQKTKVLILKPKNTKETSFFYINGNEIENITSFNYLGIIISSNGSFTCAVKNLKNKGMRASFKFNSILRHQNMNNTGIIKTILFHVETDSLIWVSSLGLGVSSHWFKIHTSLGQNTL